MAAYVPCEGTGKLAVNLERYPSRPDGLGFTKAKTFGVCPGCGRTVMNYGVANSIKVTRHKAREAASV